jgi:hypothetical protein
MDYAAHLLESTDFAWGLIVMGVLMLFLMFYAAYMRMQSLYLTATNNGREKIGSKFYYIVEESEYNRLKLAELPTFGRKQGDQGEDPVFMYRIHFRSRQYWNGTSYSESAHRAKFYWTRAEAEADQNAFRLIYPLDKPCTIFSVAISELNTDAVGKAELLGIARQQLLQTKGSESVNS